MESRQVSAMFAAYVWFSEWSEETPVVRKEALAFARENWRAFLPCAPEGLGRLLLRIAEGRNRGKSRRKAPRPRGKTMAGPDERGFGWSRRQRENNWRCGVVLVEAEDAQRYRLQESFQARGHEVVCRAEASDALAAFQDAPFDLAIMDLALPSSKGAEFCRRLRASPEGRGASSSSSPGVADCKTSTRPSPRAPMIISSRERHPSSSTFNWPSSSGGSKITPLDARP